MTEEPPQHIITTISTLCYLTNTGAKPISIECVQVRYIDKVIELIKSYDLKYIIQTTESELWNNVIIYRDDIICEAFLKSYQTPITKQDHILNGIFFGYGLRESIEYANKQGDK